MLRIILKLFLVIILFGSIFLSINYFFLESHASIDLKNTFIPSQDNINDLEQQTDISQQEVSAATYSEFTEETINKGGFYIRIDKVNLFKRVVKDVDPRYKEVYVKSWDTGVSHGKFTSYPDQIGITYIFGHATGDKADAINQKAWFSNLDALSIGDTIIIYYNGIKYTYDVSEINAVSPDATGFYTGASSVAKVRLQYCGPPTGSLSARTLVDAILTSKQPI